MDQDGTAGRSSFHASGRGFGQVTEPWWQKTPLAIVATGPSLKGFDFGRFQAGADTGAFRVLAVKEAIWDLPFAQAVFALDTPWMIRCADRLRSLKCEIYLGIPPENKFHRRDKQAPLIENATYIDLTRHEGLSDDPALIQSGGNSGFGAFNLAYLKRAKHITLFGFDYFENGAGHHFRDDCYQWYEPGRNERYWKNWGDNFTGCLAQLRKSGASVMNASPRSTVSAFPKCSLDEGIARLKSY